jgi:hypothetical protein
MALVPHVSPIDTVQHQKLQEIQPCSGKPLLFFEHKIQQGGPHCKVLFKIREAQQLIEYQQRKK